MITDIPAAVPCANPANVGALQSRNRVAETNVQTAGPLLIQSHHARTTQGTAVTTIPAR